MDMINKVLGFVLVCRYFGTLENKETIKQAIVFHCTSALGEGDVLSETPNGTIKKIYVVHWVSLDSKRMPDLSINLSEQGHLLKYAEISCFEGELKYTESSGYGQQSKLF